MRLLLLFIIVFSLPNVASAEIPNYLVKISVDSPRVITDSGSGALVDSEYVITSNHTIELLHDSITVQFQNGDKVEAKVFKRAPRFDLCLLKLSEVRYEVPVKLSDQLKVEAHQTVTVWGYDRRGDTVEITGEVFPVLGKYRGSFRLQQIGVQGISGGPAVIDGKLVGVETGPFRITGIRCANTPAIRDLLREIE